AVGLHAGEVARVAGSVRGVDDRNTGSGLDEIAVGLHRQVILAVRRGNRLAGAQSSDERGAVEQGPPLERFQTGTTLPASTPAASLGGMGGGLPASLSQRAQHGCSSP